MVAVVWSEVVIQIVCIGTIVDREDIWPEKRDAGDSLYQSGSCKENYRLERDASVPKLTTRQEGPQLTVIGG